MKREDFKRFDARMYHSAKKLIDAGCCCVRYNCMNCPAYRLNRIDNINQCLRDYYFKDQKGKYYQQRAIKYFKEFIKLYEKYDKAGKMKREDFLRLDDRMYKVATSIIEAEGNCIGVVYCINCPSFYFNRKDNINQCGYHSFKDQEGKDYTQRSINFFKEFISLYEKYNEAK